MGKWLDRVKKPESPCQARYETYETGSVGFVAPLQEGFQKSHGGSVGFVAPSLGTFQKFSAPANDPKIVPRARAYMTAPWSDAEIERFMARVQRFTSRGLDLIRAESLADKLATRDRDGDHRRLCIECRSCDVARRCSSARMAGVGSSPTVPLGDLAFMLQRCPAFKEATQ